MAKRVAKHLFCWCFVLRYDLKASRVGRMQWRGTGNKDDLFCYSTIYIKENH